MSYIALARKWRPRTFSELLGQNHLTQALTNSLNQQRIHHAYLFTGTRGVGKTSVARLLAKALNCEKGITATPCLSCDACLSIEQGRFIDLIEIDGASKTRVEDTRDVLDNVQYAPTQGRFKIYLIDEVHMLSQHSFNALLKTLEEPPTHVKFLLATTDPQKLPVTVLSRCLQFNLNHVNENIIKQHLQHILDQEKITYDVQAIALLAKSAQGSMRDALSLLDQAIASCSENINASDVKNMLGFTQQDYAIQLLQALAAQDPHLLVTISRLIAQNGGHFRYVLDELLQYLHQIAVHQTLDNTSSLIVAADEVHQLTTQFTPEDIQLNYQIALKGTEELALAPTMAIGFEMTLLRMYAFRPAPKQEKPIVATDLFRNSPTATKTELTKYPSEVESLEACSHPETFDDSKAYLGSCEQVAENSNVIEEDGDIAKDSHINENQSWSAILPQLKLRGLAHSAAEHAQFVEKLPGRVMLRSEKAHQSIFTISALTRIEEALSKFYNESIKVVLEFNDQIEFSPAIEKKIHHEKKHQEAKSALQDDPFFQQLQNEFSAELLKNSITSLKDDL